MVVGQVLEQTGDVLREVVHPGIELPALLRVGVEEVLTDPVVDRRLLVELVAQDRLERLWQFVQRDGRLHHLEDAALRPDLHAETRFGTVDELVQLPPAPVRVEVTR